MPELSLDHDQRDPLARHLDRVRMPELMRREPAPNTRLLRAARCSWQRIPAGAHGRPRVGPRRTQNSTPGGRVRVTWSHGSRCAQPQRSIPTSRRLSPFPCRMRTAPRSGSRSVSLSESASLIRSPARHSITITPRNRSPSGSSPAARITAMISATVGGRAVATPLVAAAEGLDGNWKWSRASDGGQRRSGNGAGFHDVLLWTMVDTTIVHAES